MKLKCKKCGNEEDFYIREKFFGVTELCVNGDGELTDYNSDAYEGAEYRLKSIYYYCCQCKSKVAKIPEEKRYWNWGYEMKKHLVIKYFDTYPENKFYFDSKEEAEKFLEKRQNTTRYLTTYEYRGIIEVEKWEHGY